MFVESQIRDSIEASFASLLPDGGRVFSTQASFDDGGSAIGNSPIICVAGYFFCDEVLSPFGREWRGVLNGRRFRMVHLVHGHEDFQGLDVAQRNEMVKSLVGSIKKYMTLGVAISVELKAYKERFPELNGPLGDMRREVGSPYALCAKLCLGSAARWMEYNNMPPEETIYSFESGNKSDLGRFLDSIPKNRALDEQYRFVSSSKVKKNKLPSLDAADLLAWEWGQEGKRISGEKQGPVRKSLKSLWKNLISHATSG